MKIIHTLNENNKKPILKINLSFYRVIILEGVLHSFALLHMVKNIVLLLGTQLYKMPRILSVFIHFPPTE